MKRFMLLSFLLIVVSGFSARNEVNAQRFEYNHFYVSLAPHGSWIEIDNGLLAWKPYRTSSRWAPYQAGRWVWSSYGWYWDSYESFGDITYHYGRWYNDDYYGWLWIPDNEWGPAWVEWRYDDDYIGWAPLSPYATFSVSFGIRFTHTYHSPWNVWNFVRYRHFCEHNMHNYYIPSSYKQRVFSDTKYRNDYGYEGNRIINRGIDRGTIERRGNVRIQEREIVRLNSPRTDVRSRGDRVEVYAPGRDVLTRGDVNNVKIERSERKLSLDVAKIDIGRREARNTNRDNTGRTREEAVKKTEVKREATPNVQREVKSGSELKRETRVNENPVRIESRQRNDAERTRVEERKANVRENRAPENRNAVREQKAREERQTPNIERRQEVKENRSERSSRPESRNNNDNRQREEKSETRDRRSR